MTIVLLVAFNAHAQENITLQKAIELAMSKNTRIKTAQLIELFDVENIKQAQNSRLPNLFSNDQTYNYYGRSIDPATNLYASANILGTNETLLSQTILYQGGLLRKRVLENKLQLDADKTRTAKVKNDITLTVIENYLQVLENQDIVRAAQHQIDILDRTALKLEKNIEVGYNKPTDMSQLKAQQANAGLNKANAESRLGLTMLTLKQLMEADPAKDIVLSRPDTSKLSAIKVIDDTEHIFSTALKTYPDAVLAETDKHAAYQKIGIAKTGYYPTISFFAGINTNYSSDIKQLIDPNISFQPIGYLAGNSSQLVLAPIAQPVYGKYSFGAQIKDHLNEALGLTIQIPIFNRFAARSAVRKAEINYQIANYNAQQSRQDLQKTIIQAVYEVRSAKKKYQLTQLSYKASQDAFAIIRERYALGQVSTIEHYTSLGNLNRSEFEMIAALYELVFKNKLIDYYLGNEISL
jgi:outer membrane protein